MNIQRQVNIVHQKNRRKEYLPTIGAPGGGRGISSSELVTGQRNCKSGSQCWLRCGDFLRLFDLDLGLAGAMVRVDLGCGEFIANLKSVKDLAFDIF